MIRLIKIFIGELNNNLPLRLKIQSGPNFFLYWGCLFINKVRLYLPYVYIELQNSLRFLLW